MKTCLSKKKEKRKKKRNGMEWKEKKSTVIAKAIIYKKIYSGESHLPIMAAEESKTLLERKKKNMERMNKLEILDKFPVGDPSPNRLSNTGSTCILNSTNYDTLPIINNRKNVCIDYLKFRVTGCFNFDNKFIRQLFNLLFLNPLEFELKNTTKFKKFYIFDEDVFVYFGQENTTLKNGEDCWFFEMKGHALRMFELRCYNLGVDYQDAYLQLFNFFKQSKVDYEIDIDFKRIDIAIDDYSNFITRKELKKKFNNGFYTSRLRKRSIEEEIEFFRSIESKGLTFYLGSNCSKQLCIYDKVEERKSKGVEVVNESWIRYEMRFYNDNANWVFFQIYAGYKDKRLNEISAGLLGGILDIKEDNNFKIENQRNAPTWSKWIKFLDDVEAIEYSSQGKFEEDITMNKKKDWIINCPSRILLMCYLCDPDNFDNFLNLTLLKAKDKIRQEDISRVNYHRSEIGLPLLSFDEANKLIDSYLENASFNFGKIPEYLKELFKTDELEEKMKLINSVKEKTNVGK